MRKRRVAAALCLFVAALMAFWFSNDTKAQGLGQTALAIENDSPNAVTVFITLGAFPGCYGNNPGFLQNVQAMNFTPPVTITGSGLVGSFNLPKGQTVTYTPPVGTALTGNITFGGQPLSCPTAQFPNGLNLAEFTIDNNTPAYVTGPGCFPQPQEAIDISCVNGVNCQMQLEMTGGGAWKVGSRSVNNISNQQLGTKGGSNPNLNRIGVYPPGCDICTGSVDPSPSCNNVWKNWGACNTTANCNPQRLSSQSGGTLKINFKRFY